MLEMLKKGFFIGLGLTLMTKEKAEGIINELIKKGTISEKEGKEFIEILMNKSEETQQELQKKVESLVQEAIRKLDLPSKEEIKEIMQRLEAIERCLETLSKDK